MASEKNSPTYLDEDRLRVAGQNFVVLSFASSVEDKEDGGKSKAFAMKVRGVFETRAEAEAHTKRLIDMDPSFDIYVADMYRWLMVPPRPDDVADSVYRDQFLNELINGHKEAQARAKEFFEERVRDEVEAASQAKASSSQASSSAVPDDIKESLERENAIPRKMSWADEADEEREN